CQQGNKLPFTL
nr:immunoglobulin light chain junction region [Mus musculus]